MAAVERWTNLLKEAASWDPTYWLGDGVWASIADATSLIPGQTAKLHTNDGGGASRHRRQAVGTLSGSPETFGCILENVDAAESDFAIRDLGAADWVVRARLTWSSGVVAEVSSGVGGAVSVGREPLGTGPSGGPTYFMWATATPSNAGNNREVYIYGTGAGTNTDAVVYHYAGLFEASTFSPALITTAASHRTVRTLDLDDLGIQAPIQPRRLALAEHTARFDGSIGQSTHGTRTSARVWSLQTTPFLAEATARTLYRELNAPGHLEAVGEAITNVAGVAVTVEAQNVDLIAGHDEDNWQVAFELHEAVAR